MELTRYYISNAITNEDLGYTKLINSRLDSEDNSYTLYSQTQLFGFPDIPDIPDDLAYVPYVSFYKPQGIKTLGDELHIMNYCAFQLKDTTENVNKLVVDYETIKNTFAIIYEDDYQVLILKPVTTVIQTLRERKEEFDNTKLKRVLLAHIEKYIKSDEEVVAPFIEQQLAMVKRVKAVDKVVKILKTYKTMQSKNKLIEVLLSLTEALRDGTPIPADVNVVREKILKQSSQIGNIHFDLIIPIIYYEMVIADVKPKYKQEDVEKSHMTIQRVMDGFEHLPWTYVVALIFPQLVSFANGIQLANEHFEQHIIRSLNESAYAFPESKLSDVLEMLVLYLDITLKEISYR